MPPKAKGKAKAKQRVPLTKEERQARMKARLFEVSFPELEGKRPTGLESSDEENRKKGDDDEDKKGRPDEWAMRSGIALEIHKKGLLGLEPPPPILIDFDDVVRSGRLSLKRTKEIICERLAEDFPAVFVETEQVDVYLEKPHGQKGKDSIKMESQFQQLLTVEQLRMQLKVQEYVIDPYLDELLWLVFETLLSVMPRVLEEDEQDRKDRLWELQKKVDAFLRKLAAEMAELEKPWQCFVSKEWNNAMTKPKLPERIMTLAKDVAENEEVEQELMKEFFDLITERFEEYPPVIFFSLLNVNHGQEKKLLKLEQELGDFSSWYLKKKEKPTAETSNAFASMMGLDNWVDPNLLKKKKEEEQSEDELRNMLSGGDESSEEDAASAKKSSIISGSRAASPVSSPTSTKKASIAQGSSSSSDSSSSSEDEKKLKNFNVDSVQKQVAKNAKG
ncbi:unnamed protein product [Amoebophrya sp. A120]|nr:unnamed protein product [Amoebophrya sp. A120]|eukprot:GSA120T00011623001.1